ncbi:MAG: fasciclin domain-containing protein [Sphingomonadaceae bacterium]
MEAAVASPDHKTLVAAVKAANLVDTLASPGPFTVFAPTDTAFAALPKGIVASLLEPANITKLQAVLTYHVVPGKVAAADLIKAIQAGGGSTSLKTVEGSVLTASLANGAVVLTDENGGKATVVAADVKGSNGIIHVTNAVSLPK